MSKLNCALCGVKIKSGRVRYMHEEALYNRWRGYCNRKGAPYSKMDVLHDKCRTRVRKYGKRDPKDSRKLKLSRKIEANLNRRTRTFQQLFASRNFNKPPLIILDKVNLDTLRVNKNGHKMGRQQLSRLGSPNGGHRNNEDEGMGNDEEQGKAVNSQEEGIGDGGGHGSERDLIPRDTLMALEEPENERIPENGQEAEVAECLDIMAKGVDLQDPEDGPNTGDNLNVRENIYVQSKELEGEMDGGVEEEYSEGNEENGEVRTEGSGLGGKTADNIGMKEFKEGRETGMECGDGFERERSSFILEQAPDRVPTNVGGIRFNREGGPDGQEDFRGMEGYKNVTQSGICSGGTEDCEDSMMYLSTIGNDNERGINLESSINGQESGFDLVQTGNSMEQRSDVSRIENCNGSGTYLEGHMEETMRELIVMGTGGKGLDKPDNGDVKKINLQGLETESEQETEVEGDVCGKNAFRISGGTDSGVQLKNVRGSEDLVIQSEYSEGIASQSDLQVDMHSTNIELPPGGSADEPEQDIRFEKSEDGREPVMHLRGTDKGGMDMIDMNGIENHTDMRTDLGKFADVLETGLESHGLGSEKQRMDTVGVENGINWKTSLDEGALCGLEICDRENFDRLLQNQTFADMGNCHSVKRTNDSTSVNVAKIISTDPVVRSESETQIYESVSEDEHFENQDKDGDNLHIQMNSSNANISHIAPGTKRTNPQRVKDSVRGVSRTPTPNRKTSPDGVVCNHKPEKNSDVTSEKKKKKRKFAPDVAEKGKSKCEEKVEKDRSSGLKTVKSKPHNVKKAVKGNGAGNEVFSYMSPLTGLHKHEPLKFATGMNYGRRPNNYQNTYLPNDFPRLTAKEICMKYGLDVDDLGKGNNHVNKIVRNHRQIENIQTENKRLVAEYGLLRQDRVKERAAKIMQIKNKVDRTVTESKRNKSFAEVQKKSVTVGGITDISKIPLPPPPPPSRDQVPFKIGCISTLLAKQNSEINHK